jgi:hypothetical protein
MRYRGGYAYPLFARYLQVSDQAFRRYRSTPRGSERHLRSGSSPERLLSDWVELWFDTVLGGWFGFASSGDECIPHVLFNLNYDTESDARDVLVDIPGGQSPRVTELIWEEAAGSSSSGGGGGSGGYSGSQPPIYIDSSNVMLSTDEEDTALCIELVHLADPPHGRFLAPGSYEGLIYVEEVPLAMLHIVVNPKPISLPRPPRRRRHRVYGPRY